MTAGLPESQPESSTPKASSQGPQSLSKASNNDTPKKAKKPKNLSKNSKKGYRV
jgi:hypothetical protein